MGVIAELLAEATGGADGFVDVEVGVAIYPVVDSTIDNVIGQLNGGYAIDTAALLLQTKLAFFLQLWHRCGTIIKLL